ncbi:efflux RND transporter periplasmic adaptor subunit [bacterium]|nr:efflux RND transporter periplasmic adaptor subunit [bacterium]
MSWFSTFRWSLALSVVIGLAGCKPRNAMVTPPPPTVSVAKPTQEPIVEYVEFSGNTRATDTVQLRSRVNGYLKEIHFEEGALVKKGELLFVIEPDQYEVELQSANAALQKAKASLSLAESELTRSKQLAKTNSVAQSELDVKVSQKDSAAADVSTAEANVRQAELNLSYTKIRAPLDGRIGRHLVDVGNLVQAEMTQLATIEAFAPIHVYFTISEADYLRFAELVRSKQLPDMEKQGFPIRVGLPNEEGFPHEGIVDYGDFGVDPETGTLLRRATFDNKDGALVPGLFVRIRAPIGVEKPEILVEERAIGSDQRGDFLLVVNDKNIVEYRPVKLGSIDKGRRVIKEGISLDDWVIVNGIQRARPGKTVNPQRPGDAAHISREFKHEQLTSQPNSPSNAKRKG